MLQAASKRLCCQQGCPAVLRSCQELEEAAPAVLRSCQRLEKAAPAVLRSCQKVEIAAPAPLRSCQKVETAAPAALRSCPELETTFLKGVRNHAALENTVTRYFEATSRSKSIRNHVRRNCSNIRVSAPLHSVSLCSVPPYSVHVYARVHTSIYIYIYIPYSSYSP